jgi:rod shape determining protein RodA
MMRAASASPLLRSDVVLWAAVSVLAILGLLMVQSATLERPPHPSLTVSALRHGLIAIGGMVAMIFTARLDYRLLQRVSAPCYLGAAALLLLVAITGESAYGARRWLPIAGATFQPAELAKLSLVIMLATYASVRPPSLSALLVSLGLLGGLTLPILGQPDTGTAIVLTCAWLIIAVVWGTSWRILGSILAVLMAMCPLIFAIAVPDYQRERLAVFLDPSRDPLGSGFNLTQVEIALSSGGFSGDGLFGGSESYLYGVASRSSDFIFALLGEELGMIGGLLVLTLFALIGWRGLEAARHAPDNFGRLLASGLTALILTQAMFNMAVNLRLFPVSGLPLPFLSQGGSALLVMFVAVGLLQSIYCQRPPTQRELWDRIAPQ